MRDPKRRIVHGLDEILRRDDFEEFNSVIPFEEISRRKD